MKELTKAEELIMHILWKAKRGFVKDLIEFLPDPKPAYNTVSTIIRILEKKGFVSHRAYGKSHEYYPLITKDEYKKQFMKSFVKRYFGNSFQEMVSFFAQDDDMSLDDLEEIKEWISEEIKRQRGEDDE